VVQLLHPVQTEGTDYKNAFLQPDHVPSKNKLPLPYTVAGIRILWPFMQMLSPELRIFYDIFQETHM